MSSDGSEKILMEHEEEGEGEEPWLISYADLMTLLFGFFVILFSLSSMDEKKFEVFGDGISKAFAGKKDGDETTALDKLFTAVKSAVGIDVKKKPASKVEPTPVPLKDPTLNRPADAIKKILSKTGGTIVSLPNYIDIQLPEKLLFGEGQFVLSKQSYGGMLKIAKVLRDLEPKNEIHIIGHSDSRPPKRGSVLPDNFSLSAARAGSVARYLIEKGVPEKKIRVLGMAHLSPLAAEFDPTGVPNLKNMAINRRVQIIIRKAPEADNDL